MNKNILITGGGKRIGAVCARLLHGKGCNILLHYRSSAQEAQQLQEELNSKRTDSVRLVQGDLTRMAELEHIAQIALTSWGGVDVLINNASTFYPTPLSIATESDWNSLLDSNLKAPYFLAQRLSASLQERQGCIINMVDIHAERGLPDHSIYCIAKAGLVAMTKILKKELAPNVRVNAIAPGAILWPENGADKPSTDDILSRIPLARSGESDDIAQAMYYLIKHAPYTTGQILTIDGGRTLFY